MTQKVCCVVDCGNGKIRRANAGDGAMEVLEPPETGVGVRLRDDEFDGLGVDTAGDVGVDV